MKKLCISALVFICLQSNANEVEYFPIYECTPLDQSIVAFHAIQSANSKIEKPVFPEALTVWGTDFEKNEDTNVFVSNHIVLEFLQKNESPQSIEIALQKNRSSKAKEKSNLKYESSVFTNVMDSEGNQILPSLDPDFYTNVYQAYFTVTSLEGVGRERAILEMVFSNTEKIRTEYNCNKMSLSNYKKLNVNGDVLESNIAPKLNFIDTQNTHFSDDFMEEVPDTLFYLVRSTQDKNPKLYEENAMLKLNDQIIKLAKPKLKQAFDHINNLVQDDFVLPGEINVKFNNFGFSRVHGFLDDHINYETSEILLTPFLKLAAVEVRWSSAEDNSLFFSTLGQLVIAHANVQLSVDSMVAAFAHEYAHAIFMKNFKFSKKSYSKARWNLWSAYNEFFADVIAFVATGGNNNYEKHNMLGNQFKQIAPDVIDSIVQNLNGNYKKSAIRYNGTINGLEETRSFFTKESFSRKLLLKHKTGHDVFVHMRSWLGHHRKKQMLSKPSAKKLIRNLFQAINEEWTLRQAEMSTWEKVEVDKVNLALLNAFLRKEEEN